MNRFSYECIVIVIATLLCAEKAVCSEDEDAVQTMWTNISGSPARKPVSYAVANISCNTTKPLPCVCFQEDSLFVVDCSLQNLTSVPPNIPAVAQVLNLSCNKLADIPPGVFQNLVRLETLHLSNNRLTSLKAGTFWGLGLLKTLNLNDNLFKMSLGTFGDDVFAPLSSLMYLNLKSSSHADNVAFDYPDLALGRLPSLETLLINGLSNRTFGKGVRKMTSLRTLDMSSTLSFRSIAQHTFRNFENVRIEILILSHCNLTWIHKEAFFYLRHIDTIDYSYNEHLEIKGVGLSSYSLQNSTIRKLLFKRVHTKPSMVLLNKEDLQYLVNTTLEELHMDNNSLCILGEGVIGTIPLSLKILHVSWNNIQTYHEQALKLLRLPNLVDVDVSFQDFYEISSAEIVRNNVALDWEASGTLSGNVDLFDFFGVGYVEDPSSTYITLQLPPNLTIINCSHTHKWKYTIPAVKFINSSLKYADLSHNLLHVWIGPIKGLESLIHADLTLNFCRKVEETFFAFLVGLETLLIGDNRLGNDKLGEKTFYNLTSLKRLHMNNNQIKYFPKKMFSRLTNLTYLDLSHNYLSKWNADISELVKLEHLNLANNSLKSLSTTLCTNLDRIRKFKPIRVDIRGNSLKCVCSTKYFVKWLTITQVTVKDLSNTYCTLSNGTDVPLSANKLILNHLQWQCQIYKLLIEMTSACLVLFVIIVFVGILHRHRWKLRYLFYMALNWNKRTGYETLESTNENPFGYDAFVSYEDSDLNYIREQVIPRLETEAGLKLCIDKRDFIPGFYITDNILHAIQSSKKSVVLLSREFLKSKWCMYELNMARMEGIHTGRNVLVFILPENFPVSEIPAEIVEIFQTHTYIEISNNTHGEALFWERLESAIKSA